jgi:hypothetical protein
VTKQCRHRQILFEHATFSHLKELFSFAFFFSCIDDHGSLVISRSVSIQPINLFDQNFIFSMRFPWHSLTGGGGGGRLAAIPRFPSQAKSIHQKN